MKRLVLITTIILLVLSMLFGCNSDIKEEEKDNVKPADGKETSIEEVDIDLKVRGKVEKIEVEESTEGYFKLTVKNELKDSEESFILNEDLLNKHNIKVGDFIKGHLYGNIKTLSFKEFSKVNYKILKGVVIDLKIDENTNDITIRLPKGENDTIKVLVSNKTIYENISLKTLKLGDSVIIYGELSEDKIYCEKIELVSD